MASPKIYINKVRSHSGFSLMEVLLVLAMLSIIAGTTLLFSLSSYRGAVLQAEHDAVVMQLQTARAQAQQNNHGSPYGLAFNPAGYVGYVVFAGASFATSDMSTHMRVPSKPGIIVATSTPSEVVFSQLSGASNFAGEVRLLDSVRLNASTSITINYEGAIY
jgi:prepilin-type N-terminal cleavage/methylation domain-containing protein